MEPIAVVDIGKTNAKVVLVERGGGAELAQRSAANATRQDDRYPHFDAARLWQFICGALAELNREQPIGGIVVTAHGAAGAFIGGDPDGDGLALPVMDYESPLPDELAAEYDAVRPPFSESLSPRLPAGLNLGAQIFWQQRRFPSEVEGALAYVTYPQYWSWRLCGVAANEISAIGSHTDLWDMRRGTWSSLVKRMGWTAFLAPLRSAADTLGTIRPMLAERLGLRPGLPVLCGIHDSSAALLPHVLARPSPFTVASSGTWTIMMAVGGALEHLDPKRDTLAYLTTFGEPVPAARFMGGREFELLAGAQPAAPDEAELARVVSGGVMALPSFVKGVGPFPRAEGRWTHAPGTLTPGERSAAASLYLALVTAESLACAGAGGPTLVEGPFAGNRIYCGALAAILGRPVLPSAGAGGTSRGAAHLFNRGPAAPPKDETAAEPLRLADLSRYIGEWREHAGAMSGSS